MDGMMHHGNDHDMGGMSMMSPPPSSSSSSSMPPPRHRNMMMHMTFYWGNHAEILFSGWPGSHTAMYFLSLFGVFLLSFLVECFSRSRFIKPGSNVVVSGLLRTLLHTLRMALAYLVMLSVMSFNVAVFFVAVAGHAVGFLIFESRVFGSGRNRFEGPHPYEKTSDLPPMSC